MGGAIFQRPGEEPKWFDQEEWASAQAAGYAPVSGQRVVTGELSEAPEDVIERGRYTNNPGTVAPLEQQMAEAIRGEQEREYGGVGSGFAAAGLGALDALSFGGSNALIRAGGGERLLRGLNEQHPYATGAGELGGVLAASLLPGGLGAAEGRLAALLRAGESGAEAAKAIEGASGLTKALSYTPAGLASRASQRLGAGIGGLVGTVTAETAEGAAYGFGHGVGQLALKDEPFSAEALWSELGVTPILGGAVGAGVGFAGHYGSAAWKKLTGAAENAKLGALDLTTTEGQKFVESAANRFSEYHKVTEDLIESTKGSVGLRPQEIEHVRLLNEGLDDLGAQAEQKVRALQQELAPFKAANERDLASAKELYGKLRSTDDTLRGLALKKQAKATAEGTAAVSKLGPEEELNVSYATTAYNLLRQEGEMLQVTAQTAARPETAVATRQLMKAQERADRAMGGLGTPTGARWKTKTSEVAPFEERIDALMSLKRATEDMSDVLGMGPMKEEVASRLDVALGEALKEPGSVITDATLAAEKGATKGIDPQALQDLANAQQVARHAVNYGGSASSRHAALEQYHTTLGTLAKKMRKQISPATRGAVHRIERAFEETKAVLKKLETTSDLMDTQVAHLTQAEQLVKELKAAKKGVGKAGVPGMFNRTDDAAMNAANVAASKAYATKASETAKHLGLDSRIADEFLDPIKGVDSLMGRATTKLEGDATLVTELEKNYKKVRKVFGMRPSEAYLTPEHLNKFLKKDLNEQVKSVAQLNKTWDDFNAVAASQGKMDMALQAKQAMDDFEQVLKAQIDPTGALKELDLKDLAALAGVTLKGEPGPYDNLLKLSLASGILKKGGVTIKKGANGGILKQAVQRGSARMAASFAGDVARAEGVPGLLASGLTGVAASTGWGIGAKLFGLFGPLKAAAEATGSATHAIANIVGKMAQGGGHAITSGAFTSKAVLMAHNFGDGKPKSEDLRDLYEHRKEQILAISDPLQAQSLAAQTLAPISKFSLTLFDKMVALTSTVVGYLRDKFPKDPGNIHKLGLSRWQESDRDIRAWTRHLAGATDPIGVLQRAATEMISPQEAEAVRTLYPAMFAEFQKQCVENLEGLQKNATRNQRINLSILTGEPLDTTMRPNFLKFVQQQYINRGVVKSNMAANQGKLKGSAIKPASQTELTKSQTADVRRA